MEEDRNFPPEPEPRRRVPAGQALLVVLVALLVGSLLNAERIDSTARTQPFGWQRTWAMRVTGPLKTLSHATGLHLPRRYLAGVADNELPPPTEPTETVVTAPPTVPDATTTTSAPPEYRTPTPDDPVRILVVGDSLMGWIGPAIDQSLEGRPITVIEDWEVGSGLARPDVINWPTRLQQDVEQHDPEVVVVGFGGNDAQDMATDDGVVRVGTPEWGAEYQRRVAQVLTAAEGPDRTVYWVGLPITTRSGIEEAAPAMARAVRTEVAARPWARYVDSRASLSPDGTYTAYLPDGAGGQVKVREDDGVHPNIAGARRIVEPLVASLREERKLG
ncbi:MAG TPA: DUF459 domain-containing protein [Aquihabitans sp.]|nr:DUF459 domain-containing protein [Aquihabitans sp.]